MKIQQRTFGITLVLFFSSSISFGQLKVYQDSLAYYYEEKNDAKILLYFNKILDLFPKSTYYLLHKGAYLHDRKRYSEAIETFSTVLTLNPGIIDAYVRRGISYLGAEKYDSSILDLNKALGKYRHQDSVIYKYRALAYLATKEFELSRSDYDSAIQFNPHDKELFNNRALARIEIGDLNGAREDLTRAIDEDRNYINAVKNRALVSSRLGDVENTLKDSFHYLKYFPLDENINLIVGAIYFEKKDYKTALQYLDKSKAKLKTKEVYQLSGMSHYFLVQNEQAIDDLTQALQFKPKKSEEAECYYIIGLCKNNIKLKSGCDDIKRAIERGLGDAVRNYEDECK